ncbi:uncharacterized protein LOC106670557 [Cimex lectularius]|uniref:Uncharacterized protein n=1 Tax=Cimex lectularius TaxID=79782 RepID=A0A8I6S1N4_CIMLE|nr:uncharacterized protein LOC106670557 [Cimex lectularius]
MKGVTGCLLICLIIPLAQPSHAGERKRPKREMELQEELETQSEMFDKTKAPKVNKTGSILTRILPFDIDQPRPLPVSIEIKTGSTLWSDLGTPGVINFEVTNNREVPTRFIFNVKDNNNYIRRVDPLSSAYINSGGTTLVRVELESRQRNSGPDIVTLSAGWTGSSGIYEYVTKNVYFYSGMQSSDSSRPDIWYTYGGDCYGAETPHNCHSKTWRADISIQDSGSGLIKIKSEPVGITLRKEFIAGTREIVEGFYSSSCCHTKVDVMAQDVFGNFRTLTIDIEKKWLTAGEISAIVLAVLLMILTIVLIVYLIVRCCRRKHRTLTIYPRHRPQAAE